MSGFLVDYDPKVWLAVPLFPDEEYATAFEWADDVSAGLVADGTLPAADATRMTEVLVALADLSAGNEWVDYTYLHFPRVDQMPLPVNVQLLDAQDDEELALRDLTHADDPEALEAPVVEPVTTPGLGSGLKAMRYLDTPSLGVVGFLAYAWRAGDTDVQVEAGSDDLARLTQAIPDIDELVQRISVDDG